MSGSKDRGRAWLFLAVAIAVLAPVVLVAQTAAPEESRVQQPPTVQPSERPTLPPIDGVIMEWIDEVQSRLYYDERFGTLAISDDRSAVTIGWFGEPSEELRMLVDDAPADLEVTVYPTDFTQGELQKLVSAAMVQGLVPGVSVAVGYVQNDGSGIHLGIVDEPRGGVTLDDVADAFAKALGRPDVPITIKVSGEIVPLSGDALDGS